jgi:hypothetical protein
VFQDATALDTLCKYRDGWREWPLSASDGDLAMLAQMTSEGLVDFEVDITDAKAARTEIDWNSKKAGEYKLASLPPLPVKGSLPT